MSIMYCNTHDRYWDSDYTCICPTCYAEGQAHCWACGKMIAADSDVCPLCGSDCVTDYV